MLVWLPEMNHEAYSEDFQAEHNQSEVFEAASHANYQGEDYGPETRADAVDIGYVAGVGDGEEVHGLEVVVEGRVPDAWGS